MDRILAIYPTAHKVDDILRRTSADLCVWDYRIFTFPQLVRRLWRECRDGRAAIDSSGERLLVEEAFRATPSAGFSAVPGLIDHVHGLIRQFKSAALKPDDLLEAIRTLANPGRLAAVGAIFNAYQLILARLRLADAHDREAAVLRMLHDAEQHGVRLSALDGITHLTVAEIYDFSLLQFMIVTSLIRLVGDAVVTIQAAAHETDASRFAGLTWNRFVAEESVANQVLPDFVRRSGRPGALGFLLENLFSESNARPPAPDTTLTIVRAPSRLDEVEYVAREIRRELEADDDITPARIAIVARDLVPYADHLSSVFRRYRIPLTVHRSAPLMTTPAARLLMTLVRAPLDGYRREDLAAILRSPHHAMQNSPAAISVLADAGYIDATASPLPRVLDARRRALEQALAKASSDERERLERQLRWFESGALVLEHLTAALAPLAEPGSLADYLERLDAALATLRFDFARGDRADDATRGWGTVRAILDELAVLAARGIASGAIQTLDFARTLETSMTAAASPGNESDAGGVRAMPVLEARGLDFDLVFVIGLDDGVFPVYHGEDPLLTDAARRQLNPGLRDLLRRRFDKFAPSALGKILRGRIDRNAEDPFLFFLALSMPERRVVLTYPAAETNPLVRSPFIDEVIRVLGPDAEASIVDMPAASFVPEAVRCCAREEFLGRAALDRVLGLPGAEQIIDRPSLASITNRSLVERHRVEWFALETRQDHADEGYRPDKARRAEAGRFDGRVTPTGGLRAIVTPAAGWSPSQLDDLASCAFKFFAARVLRLRDDDQPDYELSALESGSLMHEVLHRLVLAIDEKPTGEAEAAIHSTLAVIADEQRAAARDPCFFDLEWETVKRVAERAAAYHLRLRRDTPGVTVRPEHEFSFLLRNRRGPSDLAIRGRIDRLELFWRGDRINRIRVLDYKRSRDQKRYGERANPKGSEFGRIAFQLPVYLMGAVEEFRGRLASKIDLEAGYLVLRGRELEHVHPVARDLVDPAAGIRTEAEDSIADRITAMVTDAIDGRFDVDPRDCSDYCPYRAVCRNFRHGNA